MEGIRRKMGWLLVAFDLPVVTLEKQREAARFRKFLLDDGYQMIQFSVYARSLVTYSRLNTHMHRLRNHLPPEGKIRAIYITQQQWDRSFVIHGDPERESLPEQLPGQLQFW